MNQLFKQVLIGDKRFIPIAGFFIIAGLNHFVHPEFYLDLIPNYLPWHGLINILAGISEIVVGLGFLVYRTRRLAAILTIILLIVFIPSHVYFIQIGSCVENGLCVPEYIGWIRLILIHPALIFWSWWAGKV